MARMIKHIDTRLLGVVMLIFSLVAGFSLWRQNEAIAETQECMITAFSDRDQAGKNRRDAELAYLDQFILFLDTIEKQTSIEPLEQDVREFREKVQATGVVVAITDLEECR